MHIVRKGHYTVDHGHVIGISSLTGHFEAKD